MLGIQPGSTFFVLASSQFSHARITRTIDLPDQPHHRELLGFTIVTSLGFLATPTSGILGNFHMRVSNYVLIIDCILIIDIILIIDYILIIVWFI